MTDKEIAQEAVVEINQAAEGQALGRTALERGVRLASLAKADLEALAGYDPSQYAPGPADQAAIEWVKAKLLGRNPESSETFVRARRRWSERAAVEYHIE